MDVRGVEHHGVVEQECHAQQRHEDDGPADQSCENAHLECFADAAEAVRRDDSGEQDRSERSCPEETIQGIDAWVQFAYTSKTDVPPRFPRSINPIHIAPMRRPKRQLRVLTGFMEIRVPPREAIMKLP